jgi:hypothetical protein
MLRCSRRFLSALAIAAILGPVHAAELGDVRVSSYVGQPLAADIELTLIDDPAAVVGVRLASPEVYNGAGIAMPPALASLNLSVMRRDGRQFLHITSLRAIDSEHLHLYLELSDKGQRTVRLATLWLTPDPNPVRAPAAVPAALPAAVPAAAPVPAPVVVAPAAPMPAPVAKPVPSPTPVRKAAAAAPIRAPQPQPLPLPIHGVQPAAPAACAQQAEQAKVCLALDGKNAALREQIGALEGKVKVLQGVLKAAPAPVKAASLAHAAPVAAAPVAAAPAAAAAAAKPPAAPAAARPAAPAASVPAAPKPIHAIKPLVPIKPKAAASAPAHEAGLPWGWIGAGAGLLLALGAAAAVVLRLRRRAIARAALKADLPKQPRLAERLRHTFPNRSGAAAAGAAAGATAAAPKAVAEMAEPSFE